MTAAPAPRLEVVVPCYNEADRLASAAFLQTVRLRRDTGFVFVNDGSTDGTSQVLAELVAAGDGRCAAINLPRNLGKAAAVRSGVLAALNRGPEFVGYWDADLSTPLEVLQDFMDVFDANPAIDIVMGARVKLLGRHIERLAFRHYTGRLFATAASLALNMAVYDTQCGAKIFRVNSSTRQVFVEPFRSHWVFDVELLARYLAISGRAQAMTRIYELPLMTWTDVAGSKVKPWHGVRAMWDVVQIWRRAGRG